MKYNHSHKIFHRICSWHHRPTSVQRIRPGRDAARDAAMTTNAGAMATLRSKRRGWRQASAYGRQWCRGMVSSETYGGFHKPSILVGCSIIDPLFWGTLMTMETPI